MKTAEPDCPHALDIPEFLLGRLSPPEAALMEEHLRTCPSCSRTAADFQRVLERLQQADDVPPAISILPNEMRVSIERPARGAALHSVRQVLWRWAAAVLLAALATWGLRAMRERSDIQTSAHTDAAIAAARAWLEQTQEPDGSWDAAKWGAQKQYRTGLSALALLAYMTAMPRPESSGELSRIERGITFLLGEQEPDGRFGPFGSCTPYNHALCTLALLEAHARHPRAEWKAAIDRAVAYIRAGQRASGAWGYPRRTADAGNSSITIWNVRVLQRAETLGWSEARDALDRAYAWLRSTLDENGRVGYRHANDFPFGYETLTAGALLCAMRDQAARAQMPTEKMFGVVRAAAPDVERSPNYYSAYFLSRALSLAPDEAARRRADQWRRAMVNAQSREGLYQGSCEPRDRWSAAGGRVYATAMAVLAMTPE